LAYFNLTGTTDTLNQTSGYCGTPVAFCSASSLRVNGNLSGNPATQGQTYEVFWIPVQFARVGVQYTAYNTYNGATNNYDGFGRNASDNNTLFLYVWVAY
jgi:hypothetical protein